MSPIVGIVGLFGALVSAPLLSWGQRFDERMLDAFESWGAWLFPFVLMVCLLLLYPWHFAIVLAAVVASVAMWIFIVDPHATKSWRKRFHRAAAFGIAAVVILELWLSAASAGWFWWLALTGGIASVPLLVFLWGRCPGPGTFIPRSWPERMISACLIALILPIPAALLCFFLREPRTIEFVAGDRSLPAILGVFNFKVGNNKIGPDAVEALLAINNPSLAMPALETALKGDRASLRSTIAEALVTIGKPEVNALIPILEDVDLDLRKAAADALVKIGEPSVRALIAVLRDRDPNVRKAAADALVEIGKPAVPALGTALKDQYKPLRREAAIALGHIRDASAVHMLIGALTDNDSNLRRITAEALGEIGDKSAVPSLQAALKDHETAVRDAASEALRKIR